MKYFSIAVIADIQANKPALDAFISDISGQDIKKIVNLGDAVSIGPHPRECIETVTHDPRFINIMGNHDEVLSFGVEEAAKKYKMGDGEINHQKWTYQQVPEELCKSVCAWPYEHVIAHGDLRVYFCHYAMKDGSFKDLIPAKRYLSPEVPPTPDDLDELFEGVKADIIFCGHDHYGFDVYSSASKKRYLNPGSLGCHHEAKARYAVVKFGAEGIVNIEQKSVAYCDRGLIKDFTLKNVPEKEFILEHMLPRCRKK